MSSPSPDAAKIYVIALILPWAAVLPTLGYGFTHEDWLFLWAALDPQTAPAGATGSFVRPVAFTLWKATTAVAGDHPLGMHAAMVVLASLLVLGLVRLLLALGIWRTPAIMMATALFGGHVALVELRLWASASNGLLAGALAVWGAALLLVPRWRIPGAVLLLLGIGARADAGFLVLVPALAAVAASASRWRPIVAGALVALLLALGGFAIDRWHTFQLAHTGELARRMVIPWGGPLPAAVAVGVGAVACATLTAGIAWRRERSYRMAGALVLVPLLAAAFVPWAPAGRYLLVPVVGMSIAVGRWAQAQPRVWRALPLVVWITLNLGSNWIGTTARDLWQRSSVEVSLYRAVRELEFEDDELVLVDAPAMGWRGEPADAENVVSVAARRRVAVRLVDTAPRSDPRRVLAFANGRWRLVR